MIITRLIAALFITVSALPVGAAEDVDPANDGSQYLYAGNLGWLNAEPQGNGGPGLDLAGSSIVGWLWSANTGWVSLNCSNTDSCGTVNYGVSHDGAGNLTGYGWSPNIGWISFSCEDSSSCSNVGYGITLDLGNGQLSGHAYAANAGWLTFSCEATGSCATVEYHLRIDPGGSVTLIFKDGFET